MPNMVSGHCVKCYGTGQIRRRNQIGMISLDFCKNCRGIGKKRMIEGSGEHRMASKVVQGLGPGIRKGHSKYDAADGKTGYGRR